MTGESAKAPGQPKGREGLFPTGWVWAVLAAAALVLLYPPRSRDPALVRARDGAAPGSQIPSAGRADRESRPPTRALAAAREKPDVRAGILAAILVGFFAFVLLAAAGLFVFYNSRARDATFVKVQAFPAPRLQTRSDGLTDPEIARQKSALDKARWIDRAKGVFQVPIDEAMQAVAARGAKAYDPVP
ncbi:MAG TPA: hypothetical protein VGG79_13155 [Roseiarcus sp.]|jgi:hypothetical protein